MTEVDPATVVENKVQYRHHGCQDRKDCGAEPEGTASDVEESPKTAEAEEEVANKVANDTKDEAEAKVDDRKAANETRPKRKQLRQTSRTTTPSLAKQKRADHYGQRLFAGRRQQAAPVARNPASSDGSGNE